MMRIVGLFVLSLLGSCWMFSESVGALSLKLAPLEYRTELQSGEKKRGFIDVSNPATERARIRTSTQAFRQTDSTGSLEFFDDEQVEAGVRLDLDEFELGPHEAIRMYFELDPDKLPPGDVFGAIFFTVEPTTPTHGVGQSVRLGTLLSIINGAPGSRTAAITDLSLPSLQLSDTISGSYTIKNTAPPGSATGFYPTVTLRAFPFGERRTDTGKLVFAGNSRQNEFSLRVFPLGIFRVTAEYQQGMQSRWVIVASPVALVVSVALVAAAVVAWQAYRRYRQRRRRASMSIRGR